MSKGRLIRASKAKPCEVCGTGSKGCSATADGLHFCRGEPVAGWKQVSKDGNGFGHYRRVEDRQGPRPAPRKSPSPQNLWPGRAAEFAAALTPEERRKLSESLKLPADALDKLPSIGFYAAEKCYTFAECDGAGKIIGILRRFKDGRKMAMSEGRRGLTLPRDWRAMGGPLFVVEGPTDTAGMVAAGLCAVGRPSNASGAEMLADLLRDLPRDREIYIVGENDQKDNGDWPGRDGAEAMAVKLAELLQRQIRHTLPPASAKDVRDWLSADSQSEHSWHERGAILAELLIANAITFEPPNPATATPSASIEAEERPWPAPLAVEAFIGPIGDFVRAVEPATEADPAAMLVQALILFGNAVGRSAHVVVGGDKHYCNEFAVIVGDTAGGRKGTSCGMAKSLFSDTEADWRDNRQASGLSSGEGLIHFVRDPVEKRQPIKKHGRTVEYETVIDDQGETDKRGMIIEAEFVGALKQAERQGNTLSPIVREAWDSGTLRVLTKNTPTKATNAHISLIGHITEAELKKYLLEVETANGFANRFLWIMSRRTKFLPEEPPLPVDVIKAARKAVAIAVADAKIIGEMRRDAEAQAIWCEVYKPLETSCGGLAGPMLARAAAHVNRLSLIYALTERSSVIKARHLKAALAAWDYAVASVKYLFGDSTGDGIADDILALIRRSEGGITRSEINSFFNRNVSSDRIGRALVLLLKSDNVRREEVATAGRPAERWFAAGGRR